MQTLTVTGTGRYVRVNGTARATAYGYSLWEFQVYGTIGSTSGCNTATNAALNKPATASSTESAGHPGLGRLRRQRRHPLVERLHRPTVDPGRPRQRRSASARSCCVWEAAYGTAFQIQMSAAAAGPWTTIYSTTTGTGGTQTLTVTGSGRYVRLNGTARATQ